MRIAGTFVGTLVSLVGLAACGSTVLVTDGEGGAGGSTDAATSGKSTSAKTSNGTNATQASSTYTGVVSSAASGPSVCDDIGLCSGDGFTPSSGCIECAVLGDSSTATDGGACLDEFVACFGDGSKACTGAGEIECCVFYDCVLSCDANQNGEIEAGLELDCYCSNDGAQCLAMHTPGTCLGDFPSGAATAVEWESCLIVDVCPFSCGGG